MATPGGRVMLNEKDSLPLTMEADGTFAGNFTVKEQGFYKIELEGPHGEKVDASPQYTIDVLTDQSRRSTSTSRGATRTPARSKKCSPRCGPTTTSASSRCRCSTR